MNCCEKYGDCRQGRDCPMRKEVSFDVYKVVNKWYYKFWNLVVSFGPQLAQLLLILVVLACVLFA